MLVGFPLGREQFCQIFRVVGVVVVDMIQHIYQPVAVIDIFSFAASQQGINYGGVFRGGMIAAKKPEFDLIEAF
jgi:hypothetical protein